MDQNQFQQNMQKAQAQQTVNTATSSTTPEKTKFNAHLAYPMPPLKNPQTVNSGTIMVANVASETSTQGIQQTKDKRQKDRFSAPHLGYPLTYLDFVGQKRKAAADLRTR